MAGCLVNVRCDLQPFQQARSACQDCSGDCGQYLGSWRPRQELASKLTSGMLLPAGSADARCLTLAWMADVRPAGLPLLSAASRVCMMLNDADDGWPDQDTDEARSAAATCSCSEK